MVTWAKFEAAAPAMASIAELLWPGIYRLAAGPSGNSPPAQPVFSIAYLATTRRDGSARLHPFCPILAGGRLFAAIPPTSPKGNDLRRDGRCAIHALPGPNDDELCIRARATEVEEPATRGTVEAVVRRSGVGGMIETVTHHPLFEFDIERVDVAYWVDVGQPGTYAVRLRWPEAMTT